MDTNEKQPSAKKWTAERVKEHLNAIMQDACEEDVSCLAIALVRQGLYKQIWGYWKKIFADDEEIMEEMMRIDTVFEAKLYHSALTKKVSPWIAMLGLKHNHKWESKSEQPKGPGAELPAYPHQGHESMPTSIIRITDDEMYMFFKKDEWNGLYRKEKKDGFPGQEQKNLEAQ